MNLDLTEGHVNTLSDSAAEIASNVQNPTTIYIMASEDIAKSDTLLAEYGIKYSQVSALAEKMAERNSNISVEYIDLDQNPAFASEYQDDGLMTADVLVKTDKRYRVLACSMYSTAKPGWSPIPWWTARWLRLSARSTRIPSRWRCLTPGTTR